MACYYFHVWQRFQLAQRDWPFNVKVLDWNAIHKIAEIEIPPVPPVLKYVPPVKLTKKRMFLSVLVSFSLVLASLLVIPAILVIFFFHWIFHSEIKVTPNDGQFQVTVLSVNSQPGLFSESLRVQCPGDMKANLEVIDLQQVGFFPVLGSHGESFYHQGNPYVMGNIGPVKVNGPFSTCDISFKVTTTATNVLWHEKIGDYTLDTSHPTPLTVSAYRTNWPGNYNRDSALPLANLGGYKILLCVQ